MTSTNIKAQIDSLLADNTAGDISALDLRTTMVNVLNSVGGVGYYTDSTETPTVVNGGVWSKLPMDGTGALTDRVGEPYYITTPLIDGNERVSLAELGANSSLHFRFILSVTTTTANQIVRLKGIGKLPNTTTVVEYNLSDIYFKTAGTYEVTPHFMAFNDPNLQGGTLELDATSDSSASIVFHSILIRLAG